MEKGRVKGVSSISFVPSLSIQFFTVSLRGERERERERESGNNVGSMLNIYAARNSRLYL
jgi:hypothetical protein